MNPRRYQTILCRLYDRLISQPSFTLSKVSFNGLEWEWEETPEVSIVGVDSLDDAVRLFNDLSPRLVGMLLSDAAAEHERFSTRWIRPSWGTATPAGWSEGIDQPVQSDLISMLANGKDTRDLKPVELLGNLILLIVGVNDTTRNSISGGVLALNQNPDQYAKLMADRSLIPSMASEIVRWQTPLTHMARNATRDTELGGKKIKEGDRISMWYVSGNRDEEHIDRPNDFIIDRPQARQHLSFGFGVHRCMGNRLAEMQLRVLWEEILKRYSKVELVGEPIRTRSTFIRGYTQLPVKVHPI